MHVVCFPEPEGAETGVIKFQFNLGSMNVVPTAW